LPRERHGPQSALAALSRLGLDLFEPVDERPDQGLPRRLQRNVGLLAGRQLSQERPRGSTPRGLLFLPPSARTMAGPPTRLGSPSNLPTPHRANPNSAVDKP